MTVVVLLLAVSVAVLALIVFGLLRTHAEILRALDRAGISLDEDAPADSDTPAHFERATASPDAAADVIGTIVGGGSAKVAVTGVSHLTLLAFLSSGCRTCKRFWEAFAEPRLELPGVGTRLVIVGQDPGHDSEPAFAALVPSGVKAVLSSAAWEDYKVPGSPYFALVDGSSARVVGAGTAVSWQQLRDLLQRALDDAGLAAGRSGKRGSHRLTSRDRMRRADEALRAAGIGPGHRSLYPDAEQADADHAGSGGVPANR